MEENYANTLDQLRKRIDAIIEEKPSHKGVLQFLKEVMIEQYRMRMSTKAVPVRIKGEKTQALIEGNPLLDKKVLRLDITPATKLFKKLCGLLDRSDETSGDAKRVNQALRNKDINFAELFKHVVTENDESISALSKKLKVRDDLLFFLAGNSIRPVFEAYAGQLKGSVDQDMWWRGYCPICGSMPFIAEFREEGERFLVCSLCGFEWRFTRLKCPFCENDDHKRLRYFYTKNEGTANRVDVCERCKKYIKTVDTREMDREVIPIIEDMGTLYLDVLAQQEGYLRGGIPHGGLIN
jgi:FdhE protein